MLVNGPQYEWKVFIAPLSADAHDLVVGGVDKRFVKALSISYLIPQLVSDAVADTAWLVSKSLKYSLNFSQSELVGNIVLEVV